NEVFSKDRRSTRSLPRPSGRRKSSLEAVRADTRTIAKSIQVRASNRMSTSSAAAVHGGLSLCAGRCRRSPLLFSDPCAHHHIHQTVILLMTREFEERRRDPRHERLSRPWPRPRAGILDGVLVLDRGRIDERKALGHLQGVGGSLIV